MKTTSILYNVTEYRGFKLSTYISDELGNRQESTIATKDGKEVFGTFSLTFDSVAKMITKIDALNS